MVVQTIFLWSLELHAWQVFYEASTHDFLPADLLGWLMHWPERPRLHQEYFEGMARLACALQVAMAAQIWQLGGLSRAQPALAKRLLIAPIAVHSACVIVFVGHFPLVSFLTFLLTTGLIWGSFGALVKATTRGATEPNGNEEGPGSGLNDESWVTATSHPPV